MACGVRWRCRGALPVLRQRGAQCLQLAREYGARGAILRRLPSQPHHPRPHRPGQPGALAQAQVRQASAVLYAVAASAAVDHPQRGRRQLAFDFLSGLGGAPAGAPPVLTGHAGGLVTLNVEEADDPERERRRKSMREPYRTLLVISVTRLRTTTGTAWWRQLRRSTSSERCSATSARTMRQRSALYADGPSSDWSEHYVTAYASAHPWEYFAETWAHYFHMVDTLETAGAFGLRLRPKVAKSLDLSMVIDFDPHTAEMDRIIDAWLPLTFAVNSINRSMGQPDLYPFVLPPPVIWKLTFVHNRVHAASASRPQDLSPHALRAIVAGLKRPVGSPPSAI